MLQKQERIITRHFTNAAIDIAFDPVARAEIKGKLKNLSDAAIAKASAFGAGVAGLGAAGAAGVAAAGITAFLATSYLKGKIQDVLDARMLGKAARDNVARKKWDEADAVLRGSLGRDLTPHELTVLYNQFFDEKKKVPPPP